MANVGKVDQEELKRLLDDGMRNKDLAKHFGVTPGAISQAVRRLTVAVATVAATQMTAPPVRVTPVAVQAAGAIVEKRNQAMEILIELVNKAQEKLTWIEQNVVPKGDAEYREWLESGIKHTAEIRKTVTAMADVGTKIYNMVMLEQALIITLEEIKSESPECQKRIRDRLARAHIYFPVLG